MNRSKRDVLRIAAGLPALAATMSRVDAFEALAKPDGMQPVAGDWRDEMKDASAAFSPTAWAVSLAAGTTTNVLSESNINQAAAALNTYKRARLELVTLLPELGDVPGDHPFIRLDEAVYAIWGDAWFEGLRAGAAFENLRRELLGAQQSCIACDGLGVVDGRGKRISGYSAPPRTKRCPECDGTGLVPTAAVKGRSWR